MKKQVLSSIIAIVMVLSAVCMIARPEQVSAATKPYMLIDNYNYHTGKPFEKIGKYYIWMQYKENGGLLKCAVSQNGKAKTIKKISGKNYDVGGDIVTNGDTIYYGIEDSVSSTYTVYKTNVKAEKSKKIVTVKGITTEAGGGRLSGYYNGKLYFCLLTDWGDTSTVYVYDISKKRTKVLRQDGFAYSSYGPYILTDQRSWGHSWKLYNAKTNKFTKIAKLGDVSEPVLYGKYIYSYKQDGASDTIVIKRYDRSSKKMKNLKKLKNAYVLYMGKKAVYYTVGDSQKVKKWTYK